jgi:hypothetical protein
MTYEATYESADGFRISGPATIVASFEASEHRRAKVTARMVAELRAQGVKALHPDDGWVRRDRDSVYLCYPYFDDGVNVGDIVALGDPAHGVRLVRITRIEPLKVSMSGSNVCDLYFEAARVETGAEPTSS